MKKRRAEIRLFFCVNKRRHASGESIQIVKGTNLDATTLKGADILISGVGEVTASIITGDNAHLVGLKSFNHTKVHEGNNKFKGNIEVSHATFRTTISTFNGLDMKIAHADFVGQNLHISDYVEIAHVNVIGDAVEIDSHVRLIGLNKERLLLGSNLKMTDFASFIIDEDGISKTLSNQEIGGDFVYTGL